MSNSDSTSEQENNSVHTEVEIVFESEEEESSSSASAPQQVIMTSTSTDMEFEGETLKVLNTPNTITKTLRTVYKKRDRGSLTPDKFNDFWAKAIRFQQTEKFAPVPLTISTSEDLDKSYNLQMGVQEFETVCYHYDMHDVFTIIRWDKASGTPQKVGNLFKDYSNLTVEHRVWFCSVPLGLWNVPSGSSSMNFSWNSFRGTATSLKSSLFSPTTLPAKQ